MAATTPVYHLPYPAETDRADVPVDMQALANAVDAALPVPGSVELIAHKGQPNGYAALDATGKVLAGQLPAVGLAIATKAASYVLALVDANQLVEMNVAGANTVTVPPDSGAAFPVGTQITIAQLGGGNTSIVAGAGVTLRGFGNNLKLAGQYAVAAVIKRAANDWYVVGNVVP